MITYQGNHYIPFWQQTLASFALEHMLDKSSSLASFFLVSLDEDLISAYNAIARGHSW